jgi:hypothetical protein
LSLYCNVAFITSRGYFPFRAFRRAAVTMKKRARSLQCFLKSPDETPAQARVCFELLTDFMT